MEEEKIAKATEQEKFKEQMMTRIALLEKEMKTKESTLHLQTQEVNLLLSFLKMLIVRSVFV